MLQTDHANEGRQLETIEFFMGAVLPAGSQLRARFASARERIWSVVC